MRIPKRIELLEMLFTSAGDEIVGRTKLHKLAYLCQEAGSDLQQEFTWYLFGVFSASLDFDIQWAIDRNILEEEQVHGNVIITRLGNKAHRTSEKGSGFALVEILANSSSQVLEVLSTVVYLNRLGYSGNKLLKKLRDLKGHLRKFELQALELAKEHFNIEV